MKETFLLILVAFGSRLLRLLFGHQRDQEILMLRKELQILKRQTKKPCTLPVVLVGESANFRTMKAFAANHSGILQGHFEN